MDDVEQIQWRLSGGGEGPGENAVREQDQRPNALYNS